jgi:uncharacterized membrane protein YfcA
MHDLAFQVPVLFAAGVVTAVVNVLAGGGSMISLPVLIFVGLDPVTANGTNRIAIVAQNATAVAGFQRQRVNDYPLSLRLAAAAVPGALLGAWLASRFSSAAFKDVLAAVLVASVIALFLPQRRDAGGTGSAHPLALYPAMFAIGLYGGFIQVGVGFLFMLGIQRLLRLDLVRVNVHKVLIVLLYTIPALLIFVWMGKVNWPLGLALGAGNASGAWVATYFAVRGGEHWIKVVVAVVVVVMAIKLFIE